MKILNLANKDKSDINYQISSYPDGQQDIVFKQLQVSLIKGYCNPNFTEPIQIQSRFNSFKDLELIICTTKALRRIGVKQIHLYIPYLLGARSDRQFVEGGTSYLVYVIAPIINSLEFESVTVMDVHSDVAAACIKNLKVIDNVQLVNEFILAREDEIKNRYDDFILISPDAGSLKKIYKVADAIGYKGDIITCSKYRDVDGKLSKTLVPLNTREHSDKDFIIIDDICDGGRTFINIADNIKQNGYTKNKIYLIITHSIFSKSTDELLNYFDGIYTTNSYKEHDVEKIKVFNIFFNIK